MNIPPYLVSVVRDPDDANIIRVIIRYERASLVLRITHDNLTNNGAGWSIRRIVIANSVHGAHMPRRGGRDEVAAGNASIAAGNASIAFGIDPSERDVITAENMDLNSSEDAA